MIERLIQWGESQPAVRAMILTSNRAVPNAPSDIFSDYDLILVLTDMMLFFNDRAWLEDFGRVLAQYHDPLHPYYGFPTTAFITQYEDGLKIDFTLWPAEILQRIVEEPDLPDEFDAGYQVLLDKDGLTKGLKPPTYQAYIPTSPSESEYLEKIEGIFLEATYVAKYLWRDDLMAAKYILDGMMKQEYLLPMLVWHFEIEHNWSVKPGPYGRRLKKWLRGDLWRELENTYTGAGLEENWEAMFRTINLFRKAALEVGDRLGYVYPHDLDRRGVAYLLRVKNLDPGATRVYE